MWCSGYIVCPSVLSCSNLKLHQTLEVKNIFIQENIKLQLMFNPGLTLTGFRTTRPWLPLLRTEGISLAIVKHNCCNTQYILASILRTLKPPVLRGRLDQTNKYSAALLFSVKCRWVKSSAGRGNEQPNIVTVLMFYKAINLLNWITCPGYTFNTTNLHSRRPKEEKRASWRLQAPCHVQTERGR